MIESNKDDYIKGGGKICRHKEKCVDEGVLFSFGRYKKSGRLLRSRRDVITKKETNKKINYQIRKIKFREKKNKIDLFCIKKLLLDVF